MVALFLIGVDQMMIGKQGYGDGSNEHNGLFK